MDKGTARHCKNRGGQQMVNRHIKKLAAEHHIIDVCAEIGSIANCNPQYTGGITRRIEAAGKSIEELTVGELLKLNKEYNSWFNSLFA